MIVGIGYQFQTQFIGIYTLNYITFLFLRILVLLQINEIETPIIKKRPTNLLELHNLSRGKFAINNKAEDIYYMVHGNCIDIFNLWTWKHS